MVETLVSQRFHAAALDTNLDFIFASLVLAGASLRTDCEASLVFPPSSGNSTPSSVMSSAHGELMEYCAGLTEDSEVPASSNRALMRLARDMSAPTNALEKSAPSSIEYSV